MSDAPTWTTWREALHVVGYPPHLWRTLRVAAVVGTVLFVINQLDVVLRGEADAAVAGKVLLTYVVPFAVANYGILIATRRR